MVVLQLLEIEEFVQIIQRSGRHDCHASNRALMESWVAADPDAEQWVTERLKDLKSQRGSLTREMSRGSALLPRH
jgi:hypothetical protein